MVMKLDQLRFSPIFLLSCLVPCVLFAYGCGRRMTKQTYLGGSRQRTARDAEGAQADAYSYFAVKAKSRQVLFIHPSEGHETERHVVYETISYQEEEDDEEETGQYHEDDDEDYDDDDDDEDEDEDEGEEEKNNLAKEEERNGIVIYLDAERVDRSFLTSSSRIRRTMLELVEVAEEDELEVELDTICCYQSDGVVCSADLSNGSHMFVATFPELKTLSAKLSIFGATDLIHLMRDIEQRFDKRADPDQPVLTRYEHTPYGPSKRLKRWRALEHDITEYYLGNMHGMFYKQQVRNYGQSCLSFACYLGLTPCHWNTQVYYNISHFQRIDVIDVVNTKHTKVSSYEKSVRQNEDTYESKHPELFLPTRVLFLDGVTQSTSREDEAYHEALVHPAMFAHDNPKRVAIIGGGEGATLREVLKHETVEHCKMIEIDEMMVDAARDHLPLFNDCSPFSEGSCFDEPRADLLIEDAFAWFMNHFKLGEPSSEEKFDVVIFDALDPEDPVEFAQSLYQNKVFWGSIFESLTEDGILVMQVGGSPDLDNYAEQYGADKNRAVLFQTVTAIGFQRMHVFEEDHCGFDNSWSFLVACKSEERCSWLHNEAEVELKIRKRILPRHDGKATLKYFDGSTMFKYQAPSRAWEEVYCRAVPQPLECLTVRNVRAMKSQAGLDGVSKEDILLMTKDLVSTGSLLLQDLFPVSLDKVDGIPCRSLGCNRSHISGVAILHNGSQRSFGPVVDRNRRWLRDLDSRAH